MENGESITFGNSGGAVKSNNITGDVNQITIYHGSATQLPVNSPIRYGTTNSDSNFTGRSKEMCILDQCFEKSPYIVVVSGMGGIGKTSLVRKYVDSEKFQSHNVIWINAQQRESIRKDFESLASILLNTDGAGKDFKSISNLVLSKLCNLPTLIVLDNVDDEDVQTFVLEKVLNLRPSGKHRPRFVVTSRIHKWARNSVHVIPLRGLGDSEAVELVTKLLTTDEPNDEECPNNDSKYDIMELIKILQGFPLTIRQAIAYINNQREVRPLSINKYINEYNSCRQELLDSKLFQDETFFEYRETTFTTWIVTIDTIARSGSAGELALRILRIIAYFEADHIRRDIFFHLNDPSTDNKIVEGDIISAVQLLVKYSMIEGRKRQSVLSIHRLVQSVMKIHLENKDTSRAALRDGLNILHKMLKQQNGEDASQTFEHGMSVFLSILEKEDLAKEFSLLSLIVLEQAFDCGKLQQCMYFGDVVSKDTITIESAIGIKFPNIEKHAKAFEMFQEFYAKPVLVFGADHPDTFTIRTSIAASHSDEEKYAQVLLMLREVYAKRVQIFGADHPVAITMKTWIADSLQKMGEHDEALKMFQDVYAKREQIFGADHPETITGQSQIANLFLKMGNFVDALQTLQIVYGKRVNLLGHDHPDTITTESWIAYSLFKLGIYPEALQMFQKVYAKRLRIFSNDNPDAIRIHFWITVSLLQMGKYAEASRIFLQVYEKRGQIFGAAYAHSNTTTMESTVAVSNLKMVQYVETLEIFKEIYEKLVKIFGGDHEYPITIKSWITVSFHQMEKYAAALQKFRDVNEKVVPIFYDENRRDEIAISCWLNYLELEKHIETETLELNRIICESQYAGIFVGFRRQSPILTAITRPPVHVKIFNMIQEEDTAEDTLKSSGSGKLTIAPVWPVVRNIPKKCIFYYFQQQNNNFMRVVPFFKYGDFSYGGPMIITDFHR